MTPGKLIETMSWKEAEQHLRPETVIAIPLGAATKEHGLHLELRNDWLTAEYLKEQILALADLVVFPTINYSYYPAFVEYPGSVSLSLETTAAMIAEICQSIAAFGPARFYIINTGISTLAPLKQAASKLAGKGIILAYTDLHKALEPASSEVSEQEGGSHADEIETSMMLYMAPTTVRLELACRDFQAGAKGRLTRTRHEAGLAYSPSGVWGDATLANKAKGEKVVKCLIEHILKDIEYLRNTPIPS